MSVPAGDVLLAPMHVDALAVGTTFPGFGTFQWTNLAPAFGKLLGDNFPFGPEMVSDDNPFAEAAALAPGVHLHFRLPRAFVHGTQDPATGGLTFPRIPNRWLVQRFGRRIDEQRAAPIYQAWLIRSDGLAADPGNIRSDSGLAWPRFDQDPVGVERIGGIQRLAPTSEAASNPVLIAEEPARIRLTAVGPGDPLFAGYYPASGRILGFHDDMPDLPSTGAMSLSYLVTGWFSTVQEDPIHAAIADFLAKGGVAAGATPTAEQLAAVWRALAGWLGDRWWSVDAKTIAAKPPLPSRLLCHGLTRGVLWAQADRNYFQPSTQGDAVRGPSVFPTRPDPTERHRIGVGETPAESIAALIEGQSFAQDLLTALQDGLLGQPVTADALRYERHARRFDSVPGGTIYSIAADLPPLPPGVSGEALAALRRPPPVPEDLRDLLDKLNQAQSRYEHSARAFEDCRWQLYALWRLATGESVMGAPSVFGAQRRAFTDVFEAEKSNLEKARRERDELLDADGDRDPARANGRLADALRAHTRPDNRPTFRLVRAAAAPFHQPIEPAIVVAGPAARTNAAPRLPETTCRLSSDIVTSIPVQIPGGSRKSVGGGDLLASVFEAATPAPLLDPLHRALLGEALLLDPSHAERIAGLASAAGAQNLVGAVTEFQNAHHDEARTFAWTANPWRPLLLVWEVAWQSEYASTAGQPLPETLVSRAWQLGEDGELVRGDDGSLATQAATYTGYAILAPTARDSLLDELRKLGKNAARVITDAAAPYAELIHDVESEYSQGQRLFGFNAGLLMQRIGLEAPPFDLGKLMGNGTLHVDPIHDGMDAGRRPFRTAPAVRGRADVPREPFLPIRAGRMTLRRLSIVDVFGQTRRILDADGQLQQPEFHSAHQCQVSGGGPRALTVRLRPRLVQPARLRFDLSDDATGPVCGWVVANHLEKSFAVHAANGKLLGALQTKLGVRTVDRAFFWMPAPGPDGKAAEAIDDLGLRYFCAWARGLNPGDGDNLFSLLSQAVDDADERVPEEDPAVSMLLGRPFALVRARLGIETAGLRARRPRLRALQGAVEDMIDTQGFERVTWPLRLGDQRARDDGLVGVFRGDPPSAGSLLHPAWRSAWGPAAFAGSPAFAQQDFVIDCATPLSVTMLMDPQARVHATTGVLPRRHLELPRELAAGARRVREAFFQTAPVLGFSATPAMPRPSDDYGEWSWAYRPDVLNGWTVDPELVEASVRAGFTDSWPVIAEGWLKLSLTTLKGFSFWMRGPLPPIPAGSRVTLAWSVPGAERLELARQAADGRWEMVERWEAPTIKQERAVTVDDTTTFRLTASAADETASRTVTVTTRKSG